MMEEEDSELNSSQGHNNSTTTYRIIPSERDLKTGSTVSRKKKKGKRIALRCVGETEI